MFAAELIMTTSSSNGQNADLVSRDPLAQEIEKVRRSLKKEYGSGRLNSTIVSIGLWVIRKAAHALFYFFIPNPLKLIEGLCDGLCSGEQHIQSDVVSNNGRL